ncbi:O-antigen ligase family protein [Sphingomonas faeni]|uniref:O-antigen ligase family protein n=1 Tax=Sphingomonas faeni TaxID=185950 RepID=UPI003365141A
MLSYVGIAVFFLWPRYFFLGVGGKGVSAFSIYGTLLLAAGTCFVVLNYRARLELAQSIRRSSFLIFSFMMFWLWRYLSDLFSATRSASLVATTLELLYLGSWFLAGSIIFSDNRVRDKLFIITALAGIAATILGVVEVYFNTPIARLIGFEDLIQGDAYTNASINSVQMRNGMARAQSIFVHPLVFGQVLASIAPIGIHLLLKGRGSQRGLGFATLLCVGIAVNISNTRSSFLVVFAASSVYFVLAFLLRKRWYSILIAVWLCIATVSIIPFFNDNLSVAANSGGKDEAMSNAGRVTQLDNATNALKSNPISGFGDNNATSVAGIRAWTGSSLTLDNYYITRAVDNGYVGLLTFIIFVLAVITRGANLCLSEVDVDKISADAACTGMVAGVLVGLSVLSIYDSTSIIYLIGGYLVARSGNYELSKFRV